MSISALLTFALAMLLLALSPGPGVFATVAQSLSSGFRSSLDLIAGIVAGDLLFLLAALLGLASAARLLGEFFIVVKLLGGAYLIWLGIRMWVARPHGASPPIGNQAGGRRRERFLSGLGITLGNPKVIVFYAGLLPNFLDVTVFSLPAALMSATVVVVVLGGVMGAYAYGADRARRLFTTPRAVRCLNRGAGTVMIGAGVAIATR